MKSERKCRCDPSTNCRSALIAGSRQFDPGAVVQHSPTVGKSGKRAKNLSAHPSLLLLLQKSSPAQKAAAAHLHKNARSSVALARPHYEGITGGSCGGRWPLQGKCLEAVQETVKLVFARSARKHSVEYRRQQQLYCDVLQFLQTHTAHAADEYNEKAPGAPGTFSCSSTLLVSRSFLSSHKLFKVFSPGISLPHTFAPFDALKPAPDREKCALSCIAQKISNILFLCFKSFSLHFI